MLKIYRALLLWRFSRSLSSSSNAAVNSFSTGWIKSRRICGRSFKICFAMRWASCSD